MIQFRPLIRDPILVSFVIGAIFGIVATIGMYASEQEQQNKKRYAGMFKYTMVVIVLSFLTVILLKIHYGL